MGSGAMSIETTRPEQIKPEQTDSASIALEPGKREPRWRARARNRAYATERLRNRWRENSLATADEDISGGFSWRLIGRFVPYLGPYRWTTLASLLCMVIYTGLNIANPYFIGLAIDRFITTGDLRGLTVIAIVLLALNIGMWLAPYAPGRPMSLGGRQVLYRLARDLFA